MSRGSLGVLVVLGSFLPGCFLFGGTQAGTSSQPAGQPAAAYRSPEFDKTADDLQAAIAQKTEGYEATVTSEGQLDAYAPAQLDAKRGDCHVVVIELLEGASWSEHAMQSVMAEGRRPGEDYTVSHAGIVYGPGVVIDNGCVQNDGTVSVDVIANFGSAMDKSRIHELGTGPIKSTLYTKTISEQEVAALEQQRAAAWEQAAIEAEQFRQQEEARRQQQEADRQARQAAASSSSSSSSGSSAPSGPSVVSVAIKNNCPSTVKIFFGSKPKFGSGRYSSISSNTRMSQSMKPGDMLWIVDDSQNGISSATVSGSTREIQIDKSCNGLSAR